MISLDQEAGVRVGSDDGRMRPSRTNSEGPIDAFDHGKVVAASTLWELADEPSRVLGQRRDTPENEKWSGRWESNPPVGASESLEQALWRDDGCHQKCRCDSGGRDAITADYFRSFATILISVMPLDGINRET